MGKQLTIEFIRKEFAKEGYKLLTKMYRNSKQKLEYICSKGHKHSITWSNWKFGRRCPYCANNIKLTIKSIKEEFQKEGYSLLTTIYKNNLQKLNYICPKGHNHFINWGSWQQGHRCPHCYGNVKYIIDFIKIQFEKEGYILLTKVYENAHQKLSYICSNGHKHSISWHSWQNGNRCSYCIGNAKLNIGFVKKEFKREGYQLLTKIYENNDQRLKYICPLGHSHYISWNNWKSGHRCPTCADIEHGIKFSGKNHPNWKGGISKEPYCKDWTKDLKGFVKQRDNYKCLNPYCNSKNPNDLTVHHIDYNKKSCGPENLITVCRSCNSKANTDRGWHKEWYQTILYRRYNYFNDKGNR